MFTYTNMQIKYTLLLLFALNKQPLEIVYLIYILGCSIFKSKINKSYDS